MHIIHTRDYDEMSRRAADILLKEIRQNPHPVLGLPSGSTPIGTYLLLVEEKVKNNLDYHHVTTFSLDEYVGLPHSHQESFYSFLHRYLFDPAGIPEENTHIPDGCADDLDQVCAEYEQLLSQTTIDIQLLGIGANGHIGFNEPWTPADSLTHVVDLTEKTRKDNSRFFAPLGEQVPKQAISMGLASIMRSRRIVLIASGSDKADAVWRMVKEPVNEGCPATILRNHPDVTVIVDAKAGARLAR